MAGSSPASQPLGQTAFPGLDADGHFHLPKGILAHVVGVAFVDALHEDVGVGHARVGKEEELGPAQRLEDGQAEEGRLERLDPRRRRRRVRQGPAASRRVRGRRRDGQFGRQGPRDGVHAVERAGEHEVVVGRQGAGPRQAQRARRLGWGLWRVARRGAGRRGRERAVEDERAGLGDDQEGEDGPGRVMLDALASCAERHTHMVVVERKAAPQCGCERSIKADTCRPR